VSALCLVSDGGEVARRRALLPRGVLVEAWPDIEAAGLVWITAEARALLDGVAEPIAVVLSMPASRVPVYYGPGVMDLGSLPVEDSVRARVCSRRGIAATWATSDPHSLPREGAAADEAVFILRRPRGETAHRWRLFRTRDEAMAYMGAARTADPEAQSWAASLPRNWEELVRGAAGG